MYLCYCKLHSSFIRDARDKESECYQYWWDRFWGLGLTNLVTVLVSVVNIVIRTVNIYLIGKIGFHT